MKSRSAAELIRVLLWFVLTWLLPIQVADIQHCVENITKMFRHGRNAPDACVRNRILYAPLSQQSRHPVNPRDSPSSDVNKSEPESLEDEPEHNRKGTFPIKIRNCVSKGHDPRKNMRKDTLRAKFPKEQRSVAARHCDIMNVGLNMRSLTDDPQDAQAIPGSELTKSETGSLSKVSHRLRNILGTGKALMRERRTYEEQKTDVYGLSYDYGSIMHYGELSSSANHRPTIIAKNEIYQKTMGSDCLPSRTFTQSTYTTDATVTNAAVLNYNSRTVHQN
ncbi:hypothetical protein KIN20_012383 [Parelaphostrongylus tenuis]|uniref:Peptidase M12A domain-containing protein n=1 Tax=Parelaphostrongylus tenuis TaxID=148309 RepID=A0AAD5MAN0_PARTN|nr:hypothetical protein KIN20_012383 [Parelaphostrongylus tenuis]